MENVTTALPWSNPGSWLIDKKAFHADSQHSCILLHLKIFIFSCKLLHYLNILYSWTLPHFKNMSLFLHPPTLQIYFFILVPSYSTVQKYFFNLAPHFKIFTLAPTLIITLPRHQNAVSLPLHIFKNVLYHFWRIRFLFPKWTEESILTQ